MLIQVESAPLAVPDDADRLHNQFPVLWPQLDSDLQRQLARRWANLIHHMRQRRQEGRGDEYGPGW
jgi:hypothetical protein